MSVKSDNRADPADAYAGRWRPAECRLAPSADASLQRSRTPASIFRMAAPDPLKNGRRPKARIAFEQGHNLPVPTVAERILTRRPRGDFFAKGAADAAECDRQRLRSTRPWAQQQLPPR